METIMRFAFSTSIYRLRSLLEAIEGISKAGFFAVEILADRPHAFPADLRAAEIATLNACLEQRRMKACSLNSCVVTSLEECNNPSWIEENWQLREKRVRYTLDCLRLAATMGIPYVSVECGGTIPASMNRIDAFRLFVANLERVLPLAEKLGVSILVEVKPDTLIETSQQALDLTRELDRSDFLKISLDAGHLSTIGEDPCRSFDALKSHIAHLHLENISGNRQQQQITGAAGACDVLRFLQHVQELNFEGYVTVQPGNLEKRAEEAVLDCAEYLREHGFLNHQEEPCQATS
jgi:fructoselysine 3-epimerase